MEIQTPLVLFTTFLAWAIGIFGTQCVLALKKKAGEIQKLCLLVAFIILVVGGIAVVFHLTHPGHIFNGFGHLSSGITQELIGIVLMVVAMVIFFLMLRRSEDNSVPAWVSIVGLVVCAILIVAMGHSYMMESRPAWNSIAQLLSLLGAAFILGPASVAIIAAIKKVELPELGLYNIIGTIVNALLTGAYLLFMNNASASFESFAYYFDPTHPNYPMKSGADVALGNGDALTCVVLIIIAIVISLIAAFIGKKQGNKWLCWGSIIVVCGLVCAIALRVVMYLMGATMFMLY